MGLFSSAFTKLKSALTRTREASTATLRSFLTGQRLSHDLIRRIERVLIEADVGVKTAVELRKDVEAAYDRGEMETGDEALVFLQDQLTAYFPDEDRTLNLQPTGLTVILVAGVNGAGKTTSIAKLCHRLREENKSVVLGACDTFRAAAVDQLEIWSDRLGVQVVKGQQGGDPAAVAFDAVEAALARNADVLILDTAGRLHTQEPLMRQLTKIQSIIQRKVSDAPHEVLLVIDATTGQNGVNQAKVFSQAIAVTGIFLTKLDGTARGGIVIAIREQLGLPVKLVGTGETPQDVSAFEPADFVRALFAE
ncbi:MAG: signal recognition particle-docking protein FtsY [Phycisphaeraceae bacterium]